MSDKILIEVSKYEIPQVLEELKKDWPTNFLLHQYIKIMEEYRKDKKKILTQTLYRHGKIDNSVFIFKTSLSVGQATDATNYFISTTSAELSDISRVLTESSDLTLREGCLFEINFSKFTPHVTQALASKGIQFTMTNNMMMWFPPEDKLEIGMLPEDVCLKRLEERHIPEINENWPHRHPGSDKFLVQELQTNFGLGLFNKSDDKLLSSALSLHSGGIFVLYTHLDHRNKGYAEIVVRSMAHEIRSRGRIPFATIVLGNTPSLNLFRKIGFKEFSRVDFILTTK